MHSFEVHSNEKVRRKSGCLGLEQVCICHQQDTIVAMAQKLNFKLPIWPISDPLMGIMTIYDSGLLYALL